MGRPRPGRPGTALYGGEPVLRPDRRIGTGTINSEISLRLEDGTELCAIVGSGSSEPLGLQEGDRVWAIFSCYAVILHVD